MSPDQSYAFLEQRDVRPTPARILIVRTLEGADGLMTALQIEEHLGTVDRSSISRTLALFVRKGIVHAVDDGTGSVKYELCHGSHAHGTPHPDPDAHPHFHCIVCGNTTCLEGTALPQVSLPDSYQPLSANYVIHGICPNCVKLS